MVSQDILRNRSSISDFFLSCLFKFVSYSKCEFNLKFQERGEVPVEENDKMNSSLTLIFSSIF